MYQTQTPCVSNNGDIPIQNDMVVQAWEEAGRNREITLFSSLFISLFPREAVGMLAKCFFINCNSTMFAHIKTCIRKITVLASKCYSAKKKKSKANVLTMSFRTIHCILFFWIMELWPPRARSILTKIRVKGDSFCRPTMLKWCKASALLFHIHAHWKAIGMHELKCDGILHVHRNSFVI